MLPYGRLLTPSGAVLAGSPGTRHTGYSEWLEGPPLHRQLHSHTRPFCQCSRLVCRLCSTPLPQRPSHPRHSFCYQACYSCFVDSTYLLLSWSLAAKNDLCVSALISFDALQSMHLAADQQAPAEPAFLCLASFQVPSCRATGLPGVREKMKYTKAV